MHEYTCMIHNRPIDEALSNVCITQVCLHACSDSDKYLFIMTQYTIMIMYCQIRLILTSSQSMGWWREIYWHNQG
jgi:hypothetical protein